MENIIGAGGSSLPYLAAWFVGSYLFHGLGITLGYHRLLTHKSLTTPRWLMYLVASGGYLGLMGSPIVWVAVHRLHHQKSDLPGDPHSPRDGFWHALVGWMGQMEKYQSRDDVKKQCKDLMGDPFLRLLGTDHTAYNPLVCLSVSVAFRVAIFAFFGLGAMLMNILATVIVFLSTQLVNAVCHLPGAGYRSHDTIDDSLNVWWVGLLALGEGWHNNHHAIPTSARHGMRWFEVDVTWYTVLLLEKLGLAKKVVRPTLRPAPAAASPSQSEPALRPIAQAEPVPVVVESAESGELSPRR